MTKRQKQLLIHIGLFLITIVTTTIAGTEWMYSKYVFWVPEEAQMSLDDFLNGLSFSIPFLLILTFHEFGHYFTAKHHKIDVTLPFYIPMWLGFLLMPSFGTMGAFIRIKDKIFSLRHYFDVGISGPLAGFVIAIGVIGYGYTHLPEPEQIYQIHPEYKEFGLEYPAHVYSYDFARKQDSIHYLERRAMDSLIFASENPVADWGYPDFQAQDAYTSIYFGKPLLYNLIENYLLSEDVLIPREEEIMHHPFLLAGLLALFFTALNLLPIGQLDGGHITFGMFGAKNHGIISRILFTVFIFYAGLGLITIHDLQDVGLSSSLEYLVMILGYLYFIYISAKSMFNQRRNRMLFATCIFVMQFALNYLYGLEGYSGWLLFAFLLGRVLGVDHPPVLDHRPLNTPRMILGWVALIVFVLSFSPEPLVIEMITK